MLIVVIGGGNGGGAGVSLLHGRISDVQAVVIVEEAHQRCRASKEAMRSMTTWPPGSPLAAATLLTIVTVNVIAVVAAAAATVDGRTEGNEIAADVDPSEEVDVRLDASRAPG